MEVISTAKMTDLIDAIKIDTSYDPEPECYYDDEEEYYGVQFRLFQNDTLIEFADEEIKADGFPVPEHYAFLLEFNEEDGAGIVVWPNEEEEETMAFFPDVFEEQIDKIEDLVKEAFGKELSEWIEWSKNEIGE